MWNVRKACSGTSDYTSYPHNQSAIMKSYIENTLPIPRHSNLWYQFLALHKICSGSDMKESSYKVQSTEQSYVVWEILSNMTLQVVPWKIVLLLQMQPMSLSSFVWFGSSECGCKGESLHSQTSAISSRKLNENHQLEQISIIMNKADTKQMWICVIRSCMSELSKVKSYACAPPSWAQF